MSEPLPSDVKLYRRVRPDHWDEEDGEPRRPGPEAFSRQNGGMSTYASTHCHPVKMLEDVLSTWERWASKPTHRDHELGKANLEQCPTLPAMIDAGWGVVVMTADDVEDFETKLNPKTGHVDICHPDEEMWEVYPDIWSHDCTEVPREELLDGVKTHQV